MRESEFFDVLRDHLPFYNVTIIYAARHSTLPFAVELFVQGKSYIAAGRTLSACMESVLDKLNIHPLRESGDVRYLDENFHPVSDIHQAMWVRWQKSPGS